MSEHFGRPINYKHAAMIKTKERFAALDLALGELCDRVEYGHLLASTDPVAFVKAVRDRLDLTARLAAALRGLVAECEIIRAHPERSLVPHIDTMNEARAALAEYEKGGAE